MDNDSASESINGASSRDLPAGTVFGDYRILRLIGRGGMGEVYEAEHLHLGRRQALKVLPLELVGDAGFRDRFRHEARVLASLEHAHIVPVHHASECGGRFFLAMDLMPGSLAAMIAAAPRTGDRPGRLEPASVVTIVRQVLDGLAYAHGRGVIHRDLKPANILLDARGAVRLADFGVAQALGEGFMRTLVQRTIAQSLAAEAATRVLGSKLSGSTSSDGLVGTLDYMAPEVRAGAAADVRADLYALGVIAYEMLTGRKPLGRYRNASALVPGLDIRWDELINSALEPDAVDRWADAPAMAHFLTAVDVPTSAAATRFPAPLRPEEARPVQLSRPPPLPPLARSPAASTGQPASGRIWTVPELDLAMAWIAPGRFTMGSPGSEPGHYKEEEPQTQVTLTRGFWLGKFEVTQAQWESLMGGNPSEYKAAGPGAPVENVTWHDAMSFCQKLTERERAAKRLPAGHVYTLPTEAQWEFTCRAGTTGPYAGTGKLDDMAWFAGNNLGAPQSVGRKRQNAWGLFDMHGNVWEWCADWHAEKLRGGSVSDPVGPASGTHRIFRGGSWFNAAERCRSAYRNSHEPDRRANNLGFRLALASAAT